MDDLNSTFLCKPVHHLTDIGQTSPTFRILPGTIAFSGLLFEADSLNNHRSAVVVHIISFNVLPGISKAIANKIAILEFISSLGR